MIAKMQRDYSEPDLKSSGISQGRGKPREFDKYWISSKPLKVRLKPVIIYFKN